jgi:hypothetical protein
MSKTEFFWNVRWDTRHRCTVKANGIKQAKKRAIEHAKAKNKPIGEIVEVYRKCYEKSIV